MGNYHSRRRSSSTRTATRTIIMPQHIVKYSDTKPQDEGGGSGKSGEGGSGKGGEGGEGKGGEGGGDPPLMILDLPNEIFLIIADELSSPPDTSSLSSLVLANKHLACLLTPHLYKLALLDRPDGTPPLHWAAEKGYTHLTMLLLEKLPEEALSRLDATGQTALHVALEHCDPGNFTIVTALIAKKINVNAQTNTGDTALKLAVFRGHEPIVVLLLKEGADISLRDGKDQTVLHVATRNWGNGGSTEIATHLLKAGVDINARNNLGETALHKAVLFAHTSMVKLLLDWKANTSIADNWWGGTPLHWAADMGKHDIGKLLLSSGAEVQARDVFKGGTPFHWAAKRPTEAMLRLLLKEGADVESVDNSGKRAVEWTVRQERRRGPREERVIAELLRMGTTTLDTDRDRGYRASGATNAYTLAALYYLHVRTGYGPASDYDPMLV